MSKRLQILMPDGDYRELLKFCRARALTVAEWVRQCLKVGLTAERPESPESKIARILKYAKYRGPTGNIERLLAEIEAGREG